MRYHSSRQALTVQYPFNQDQLRSVPQLRRSGTLPYVLPGPDRYQAQSYQQQFPGEAALHAWPHASTLAVFPTTQQSATSYDQHSQQFYGPQAGVHLQQESFESTYAALKPGPESEQIAFRDRTFTWADRIYRDLLATIHRNSRGGHQSGVSGFGKGPTKLTIYPKPPKRSGSHFSDALMKASGIGRAAQNDLKFQKLEPAVDGDPARPQTAIYSPHRRASDYGHAPRQHLFDTATHDSHIGPAIAQDSRRISDSGVKRALGLKQSQQVRQSAFNALSTIEILCEQARVPWIDGMLLAGCLAYGLGTYDKALGWCKAILAHDSAHVEAMSNLAATLLALDRRDEAMHHWFEAVKLRPSYFEAVEHLVGLLCSSRRAREAVDLIEFVESSLKAGKEEGVTSAGELSSDAESDAKSNASSIATMSSMEQAHYDYESDSHGETSQPPEDSPAPGFGSSGYAIAGSENGRMLALIHAKGNMLYALSNNSAAAAAFEDAILISTGQRKHGIRGLIGQILTACLQHVVEKHEIPSQLLGKDPILLAPSQAEATAMNMFPSQGELPGLEHVAKGMAFKAAVSTTSNSLLSLAKIYQDAMSSATEVGTLRSTSTRDILALYYLSLSLQRSPSTANNVGILLAGVQQSVRSSKLPLEETSNAIHNVPGVVPGSGINLALLYYNYGLNLDNRHAHLYTNLGSLLKDIGQLGAAIKMYESAVSCDSNFDIALANLANAVKDQGRIADAINYYRRAVQSNPDFAEAVCGLATALNSVCSWHGRGGVFAEGGRRDRIHVNEKGMLHEASYSYGWLNRVVEIVDKQLKEGGTWGCGTLSSVVMQNLSRQLVAHRKYDKGGYDSVLLSKLIETLQTWAGKKWEGSRIVRLVERAIRQIGWQWYQDRYKERIHYSQEKYLRPVLPTALSSPSAPTVLPFHTFTTPLSAKQIRQISQRNALRISVSTLRAAWLPSTVFPPPPPPSPCLNVGYVSSDFNNHPLAHLMQSVFGMHDPARVHAICYATTISDNSIHRHQIEREAPKFYDVSSWSNEKLVKQIVRDEIHVLVNLNGYTRGARNEVFAARPAPIHMSFMGFAGTLGAEWCDYVLADKISVPKKTLSPWRRNVGIEDRLNPESLAEDADDWVYSENIIFARETFFCVDHKQSAPDAEHGPPPEAKREDAWRVEQQRRWALRKQLFPSLSDSAVILGNFNQLYKIDPSTFRMYLRMLAAIPNAILWLLRFPDLGEQNLISYAREWAGAEIASRLVFTDVAPKGLHITRASVVDLFLDTPECNAHTTAADVVWSGTPIVTWGRWKYKMCSRMAGSIVSSALPEGEEGHEARKELVVESEAAYEASVVRLARGLRYANFSDVDHVEGKRREVWQGNGRLTQLRRMLWEGRWTSRLFDTKRWVRDVESGYEEAWRKWEAGEGGDIWF